MGRLVGRLLRRQLERQMERQVVRQVGKHVGRQMGRQVGIQVGRPMGEGCYYNCISKKTSGLLTTWLDDWDRWKDRLGNRKNRWEDRWEDKWKNRWSKGGSKGKRAMEGQITKTGRKTDGKRSENRWKTVSSSVSLCVLSISVSSPCLYHFRVWPIQYLFPFLYPYNLLSVYPMFQMSEISDRQPQKANMKLLILFQFSWTCKAIIAMYGGKCYNEGGNY